MNELVGFRPPAAARHAFPPLDFERASVALLTQLGQRIAAIRAERQQRSHGDAASAASMHREACHD